MEWHFKKNKSTAHSIEIDIIPNNDTLASFLYTVKLIHYPELIDAVANTVSWGHEFVHVRFLNDMDWEDKAWAKNVKGCNLEEGEMFLVHDVIGETILNVDSFDKILFDYATELLKIHTDDNILPNNWSAEMQNALKSLKSKIDN